MSTPSHAREQRRTARLDRTARAFTAVELNDACCERWWTSLGWDHEPGCGQRGRHTSAA
ncbi:hypothetical protein [Streptomyces sp. NPDC053367]|uniref:hypothetical protein n=1 Tax=Streptomyces sp. NPDC053367 TaxID=3365700 RepID=UPI0037D22E7C